MPAAIAKIFAHRAAGIWRDKLQRRGFRRRRRDHRGVIHGTVAVELLDHLRDRRALLADRDVDALHVLAALIDNRIDCNRGLAGLAIPDNQLALPAANLE